MTSESLPSAEDVTTPVHFEDLNYRNPHHQTVHPRWAGGQVVWSIPCGPVAIDPERTEVADEYILRKGPGERYRTRAPHWPVPIWYPSRVEARAPVRWTAGNSA